MCIRDSGQIRQIQIPSDYTENGPLGEFALYFAATLPCRSAGGIKTFGSLYSISPDTQVFVIPDDPADEHGFRLRNTSFLGEDKYYHIALYQVDQDYNTAVAVVYENGSELTGFSNYLPVSVVERVTLMQNEQEDTVFCLQTITDGNRSQVPISVGDIIDYTLSLIHISCPGCGSCSGMFTANSMNCLSEVLGMALPGNGTIPAVYAARQRLAKKAGMKIMELIEKDIHPSDLSLIHIL